MDNAVIILLAIFLVACSPPQQISNVDGKNALVVDEKCIEINIPPGAAYCRNDFSC